MIQKEKKVIWEIKIKQNYVGFTLSNYITHEEKSGNLAFDYPFNAAL